MKTILSLKAHLVAELCLQAERLGLTAEEMVELWVSQYRQPHSSVSISDFLDARASAASLETPDGASGAIEIGSSNGRKHCYGLGGLILAAKHPRPIISAGTAYSEWSDTRPATPKPKKTLPSVRFEYSQPFPLY